MSRFQCPGVEEIIAVMKAKAYAVFDSGPSHNLNNIGIRSDDNEANSFNDWFTVSYDSVLRNLVDTKTVLEKAEESSGFRVALLETLTVFSAEKPELAVIRSSIENSKASAKN